MQKIIQRTTRDGRSITQTIVTICDGGPTDEEIEKVKASLDAMQERGRRQFLWAAVGGMAFLLIEALAFVVWP